MKRTQALAKRVRLSGDQKARWKKRRRRTHTLPWYHRPWFPSGILIALMALLWLFGTPFHGFEGTWSMPQCIGVMGLFWVTMVLLHLGWAVVLARLGIQDASKNTELHDLARKRWGLALVTAVVWAPLSEEFAFRYGSLGFFSEDAVVWVALASSIAFGLAHRVHKPVKMVMGLGFCWMYVHAGSIWVPIVAHAGLNLLAMMALKHTLDNERLKVVGEDQDEDQDEDDPAIEDDVGKRLQALLEQLEALSAEEAKERTRLQYLQERLSARPAEAELKRLWKEGHRLLKSATARGEKVQQLRQEINRIAPRKPKP